ncbi:hypothetical protein [Leptospira johnsonii]|uniref:Uncharacterized protein n=1 Tax=Leptospira johnsonii TaxID=1917820 RepID=A0A2P2D7U7_9LEPT|nr:hypothetical protein [Leptospira johnsonii]GBF40688.1 hypothetical protein LPTSP1_37060 [Leptospira johnsonii]
MKTKFKYSDFAGKDPFPDWFIKFLRFLEFQFFSIKEAIPLPTWSETDSPPTCLAVDNRFHGKKNQVADANLFILEGNADLIAPYTNSPTDAACVLINSVSTDYITQSAFADNEFWARAYSVSTGLWSAWVSYTGTPPFPKEDTYPLDRAPSGLLPSIDSGDTAHDWNISPGWTWDTTFASVMYLPSTIIKQADATWTVGSGVGGMESGTTFSANTTYFFWLIMRTDTGVVDALFSASGTSPTMPSNYDRKRLIGVLKTQSGAASNIQVLTELWGNQVKYRLTTLVNEVSVSNLGTSRTTYTLANCPVTSGITASLSCNCSKAATATFIAITALDETDYTPTGSLNNMRGGSGAGGVASVETIVKLNSSAQFGARADSTSVVFAANLKYYFYSRSI